MIKNKILHLNASFKAKETEAGKLKISGFASTADTDRAGDVILPEAWSKGGIESYKKNPIILFNHNYNKPIGRATAISVTDRGLEIDAEISSADLELQQLIKDGVLTTFSVGFMIKDADYISATDGFLIKDAELYETSVVSVPCNQDATFSLSKSFDSKQEYDEYVKQFKPAEESEEELAKAKEATDKAKADEEISLKMETKMLTPEEIQEMVNKAAADAAEATRKEMIENAAAEKKAQEDADKADKDFSIKVTTAAEILLTDIEKRFNDKNESLEAIVAELKTDLVSKSAEIDNIRTSKRHFTDRGATGDWRKEHADEIVDAHLLGLATGKGWDTAKGKLVREKVVSTTSGVEVSSTDYESVISTNIERDIELALVLAPLFREIPMTSNTMTIPIMPDSGYVETAARNAGNATQTAPKGNLDERSAAFGTHAGADLTEKVITTARMISTSYLGNETEEDAIIPILGLIKEAMVRSHARSVEQGILLGGFAGSVYATGLWDGLAETAKDAGTNIDQGASGFAAADVITAADLFDMRKAMGKYGLKPSDVTYIVSLDAYYNLIEDTEWTDINIVGADATKLKGSVGSVYGTNVIVCDEFAAKGLSVHAAICVNPRNFIMPRLRGMRVESDYSVKDQNRVLVATQRLGFDDIITDAKSVASLQYKLA